MTRTLGWISMMSLLLAPAVALAQREQPEPSPQPVPKPLFKLDVKAALALPDSTAPAEVVFTGNGRATYNRTGVVMSFGVLTAEGQPGRAYIRWDNPLRWHDGFPTFAGKGKAYVFVPNSAQRFALVVKGQIERSEDLGLVISGVFASANDSSTRPSFQGKFRGVLVTPPPPVAFELKTRAALVRDNSTEARPIIFTGPGKAVADREGVTIVFDVLTAEGQAGKAEIKWRNPLEYQPRRPHFAGPGKAVVTLPNAELEFHMYLRGTIRRTSSGDLYLQGRYHSVSVTPVQGPRLIGHFVGRSQ